MSMRWCGEPRCSFVWHTNCTCVRHNESMTNADRLWDRKRERDGVTVQGRDTEREGGANNWGWLWNWVRDFSAVWQTWSFNCHHGSTQASPRLCCLCFPFSWNSGALFVSFLHSLLQFCFLASNFPGMIFLRLGSLISFSLLYEENRSYDKKEWFLGYDSVWLMRKVRKREISWLYFPFDTNADLGLD